jgi:hypothetical protein
VRAHRAGVQIGQRGDDGLRPEDPAAALAAEAQGRFEDTLVNRHDLNIHMYITDRKQDGGAA